MTDEIKYRKPPIVEVVCEFRFVSGAPWDAAIPGLLYVKLAGVFPRRKTLRTLQSEVSPAESGLQHHVEVTERAQFLREDEKAFAQIGPDFLAVNHLAPYPTWEAFVPLILQAFQSYCEVAKPTGLQRIGLRYINRIVFPSNMIKLEDYLQFYPNVGPNLPAQTQGFTVGILSGFEDDRDALRLQLLSIPPDEAGQLAILLDLDYFLARPQAIGLDQALNWINQAHDRVLNAFEACLTDRSRQMFEPIEG